MESPLNCKKSPSKGTVASTGNGISISPKSPMAPAPHQLVFLLAYGALSHQCCRKGMVQMPCLLNPCLKDNRRNWSLARESYRIHTGLSLKFRLLSPSFPILSLTQVTPYLRVAFCFKVRSSSYMRNFPSCRTVRRNVASIGFVRQSANIIAVETHLHMVRSFDCSLRSITSIVVRHS